LALVTLAQALDEGVAESDRRLAARSDSDGPRACRPSAGDEEAAGELRTNLDCYARAGGGDGERDSEALLAELQAGVTEQPDWS
jgi:hypothetical protein